MLANAVLEGPIDAMPIADKAIDVFFRAQRTILCRRRAIMRALFAVEYSQRQEQPQFAALLVLFDKLNRQMAQIIECRTAALIC
jgi:hypothetical protein